MTAAPSAQTALRIRRCGQAELIKLAAQLGVRILALVCVLGPFAFAALLRAQSGTPTDALFGAWVHSSGFAISLVVVGFAANWGFPLIAGVLGGDLFASEDRHGTWKTVLTRTVGREDVFAGKVLAAGVLAIALAVLTAASSLIAGLIFVGNHQLVSLSGELIAPGRALLLTVLAWIVCLLPLLAYTSLALLLSVATRNGIVGVVGPLLLALVTQLLALIGKGVWAHLLLIGAAFDGWHGLFTQHAFVGPLLVTSGICVIWITATLIAAWRILRRRDFVAGASGRTPNWRAALRAVLVAIVAIVVLALGSGIGPTGVTVTRVRTALTPEFERLTILQQRELGHTIPPDARLDIVPNCNRRGAQAVGPGDWSCTMSVFVIEPGKLPLTQTPVDYDVSVQANGCFKAQSPPAFVGGQTIRDPRGHVFTNPLFVIYGCFDPL